MFRPTALAGMSASLLVVLGCSETPEAPSEPASGLLPASASIVGAPDNMAASGVSEAQIDVTWRDNAGNETRFELFRSTTGVDGSFLLLATLASNTVRYNDHQLLPVPVLCYKARAARTLGSRTTYSAFSGIACAQAAPPAPPTNAVAAMTAQGSIELTWQDNSSSETSFIVYRTTGGQSGSFTQVASLGANATRYTDRTVLVDTRYCYQVFAVRAPPGTDGSNASGVGSSPSNLACATIPPSDPPASAYDVTARPDNSSTARITFRWSDASIPPPALRLYRSTDGGDAWALVPLPSPVMNEFLDAPLSSEQTVCYRVVAYNAAGDAAPSPPACTIPPAGPTGLVGSLSDGTIALTWSDHSATEDGYQVWLRKHSVNYCTPGYSNGDVQPPDVDTYFIMASLPANSTTYRATAAVSDPCDSSAEFWYYVVATNDGGWSDFSHEVSAMTGAPAP